MKNHFKAYLTALAFLVLVELGVAGYWLFYQSEAARGVLATAIIPPNYTSPEEWIWVNIDVILSALGGVMAVNVIAILFAIVLIRNNRNLPMLMLLLLSLGGSIGLSIRGMVLFSKLSWLFGLGIAAAAAVAFVAILAYAKEKVRAS